MLLKGYACDSSINTREKGKRELAKKNWAGCQHTGTKNLPFSKSTEISYHLAVKLQLSKSWTVPSFLVHMVAYIMQKNKAEEEIYFHRSSIFAKTGCWKLVRKHVFWLFAHLWGAVWAERTLRLQKAWSFGWPVQRVCRRLLFFVS